MQGRQIGSSTCAAIATVIARTAVICQTIHTVVYRQIIVDVRLQFANRR